MDNDQRYQKAAKILMDNGQGQLLTFYEQLSDPRKRHLLNQIECLDFSQIPAWIANYVKNTQPVAVPDQFKPVPAYPPSPAGPAQQEKYKAVRKLGAELLSAGKVAAFIVAGGQGTRLGFDGPKGDLPISPVKNKTLFQIFAETIAAAAKKYQTTLPWYIMTSQLNYAETKDIFRSNNYYGLDEKNVFIF